MNRALAPFVSRAWAHPVCRVAIGLCMIGLVLPQRAPAVIAAAREYSGPPKLQLGLAVVRAGDGPDAFKATTLIGVLAGPSANVEVAKLTKHYGARAVKDAIIILDFFVADALRLIKRQGLVLPSTPEPESTDGKALAAALYDAGTDTATGTFDVEYLLDHLVSHRVNAAVMRDIDSKYGARAATAYYVALRDVLDDLQK